MKIGIIDYGVGNIKSIENAIVKVGGDPVLTNVREETLSCDKLILPGVGAFQTGMKNLKKKKLDVVIKEFVNTKKPFLGICLGMQMLFDESEEFGNYKGLGLINGVVKKIPTDKRLPHIGWNEINPINHWENTILENIKPNSKMYFVHTFAGYPEKEIDYLASTDYEDIKICAAVNKENIYGTQFHPEKSGTIGLSILETFIKI
tara:strand:- start:3648 stop:4259 length:612 start_codon:yes stop_codon:yes gene_type:complete